MTPRVLPAARRPSQPSLHLYRPPRSTLRRPRSGPSGSGPASPAIGVDAKDMMLEEEQRVLSKAASGGGYLVPTDVGEMVTSAARAASMIAQVALELETESGETVGMALADWVSGLDD